jgi:hypothetical protein
MTTVAVGLHLSMSNGQAHAAVKPEWTGEKIRDVAGILLLHDLADVHLEAGGIDAKENTGFKYEPRKRSNSGSEPSCACRVRRRRYRCPLPSELPVTVSRQAAQAFTNVPGGTRLLWSVVLERGSADDSWHATTPSCPPCPDRLRCAKSDGESDSLPL